MDPKKTVEDEAPCSNTAYQMARHPFLWVALLLVGTVTLVLVLYPPTLVSPAAAGTAAQWENAAQQPCIDLNTATLAQLCTLPGIGEQKALAILDYRAHHGAFTNVEELLQVEGIGEKTLVALRDIVTVG